MKAASEQIPSKRGRVSHCDSSNCHVASTSASSSKELPCVLGAERLVVHELSHRLEDLAKLPGLEAAIHGILPMPRAANVESDESGESLNCSSADCSEDTLRILRRLYTHAASLLQEPERVPRMMMREEHPPHSTESKGQLQNPCACCYQFIDRATARDVLCAMILGMIAVDKDETTGREFTLLPSLSQASNLSLVAKAQCLLAFLLDSPAESTGYQDTGILIARMSGGTVQSVNGVVGCTHRFSSRKADPPTSKMARDCISAGNNVEGELQVVCVERSVCGGLWTSGCAPEDGVLMSAPETMIAGLVCGSLIQCEAVLVAGAVPAVIASGAGRQFRFEDLSDFRTPVAEAVSLPCGRTVHITRHANVLLQCPGQKEHSLVNKHAHVFDQLCQVLSFRPLSALKFNRLKLQPVGPPFSAPRALQGAVLQAWQASCAYGLQMMLPPLGGWESVAVDNLEQQIGNFPRPRLEVSQIAGTLDSTVSAQANTPRTKNRNHVHHAHSNGSRLSPLSNNSPSDSHCSIDPSSARLHSSRFPLKALPGYQTRLHVPSVGDRSSSGSNLPR